VFVARLFARADADGRAERRAGG